VVMTVGGSAIAHIALTYGAGFLWLYGFASPSSGTPVVLRISPVTGTVVATITGVPAIGGGQPALAVDAAGGVWLAGGAGGTASLERVAPGSSTPVPVLLDPAPVSILWLSAVGDTVWAQAATFGPGNSASTRLVALATTGQPITEGQAEQLGDGPLAGSARALWSIGSSHCPTVAVESYAEPLYRIDPATGDAVVATTLRSPVNLCDVGPGSFVAVAGRWVFVLAPSDSASRPSTLFRVSS